MSSDTRPPAPEPVIAIRVYVAVFLALLVLLGLTVAASLVQLGYLNRLVAWGIAVLKAVLVLLFFMHLRYSPRLLRVVVIAGFAWLLLLVAFTWGEIVTRGWPGP